MSRLRPLLTASQAALLRHLAAEPIAAETWRRNVAQATGASLLRHGWARSSDRHPSYVITRLGRSILRRHQRGARRSAA